MAYKLEKRIWRLDAVILRTERRVEMLSVLKDRYHDIVAGAMIAAEVSREQFIEAASLAFRDPYKALKGWERREWSLSNFALNVPNTVEKNI